MRNLSLVRCVGSVPARIFENVTLDNAGKNGVVITQPDVGFENLILLCKPTQVLDVFVFVDAIRQIQWLLHADSCRQGFIDKLVKIFNTYNLQHFGQVAITRSIVPSGKIVSQHFTEIFFVNE